MTKYREYFEKMLRENKELFDKFKILHDNYSLNPDHFQETYNVEGEKVLEVIREYENRLCANTERGMYNKYSASLAEKFQNEVRLVFPMIDHIGLRIEKDGQPPFTLKKINLPQ